MALTPSNMLALGTEALDFTLLNPITDEQQSLDHLKSRIATVIVFMCNHCPYVIHIQDKLAEVAKTYQDKGVSFIGINANDAEHYPDDSPEKMKEAVKNIGYTFPYLFDDTQAIAKAYQAACTPDFFVFDGEMKLVYRGQFDDSRPGNDEPITGADLTLALDALLAGKPVSNHQKPSMGCNIKWKAGTR